MAAQQRMVVGVEPFIAVRRQDDVRGISNVAMEVPERRFPTTAADQPRQLGWRGQSKDIQVGVPLVWTRPLEDGVVISGDDEAAAEAPEQPRQIECAIVELRAADFERVLQEIVPLKLQAGTRVFGDETGVGSFAEETPHDHRIVGLAVAVQHVRRSLQQLIPAREERFFAAQRPYGHRHTRAGERYDFPLADAILEIRWQRHGMIAVAAKYTMTPFTHPFSALHPRHRIR